MSVCQHDIFSIPALSKLTGEEKLLQSGLKFLTKNTDLVMKQDSRKICKFNYIENIAAPYSVTAKIYSSRLCKS